MKIDYLGHSEFLVTIENSSWKKIKILSDSWLSDYVFWDFMERNPMIKIDYSKLWNIDAIFLSHSHSDHIDPYTLLEIYKKIIPRPILIIPETIEYLVPLFKQYLPKQKIKILKNKEIFNLDWIDIQWIIFENNYITNEDDVMTLAISNEEELLFTDVDTVPPETQEATDILYDIFTRKNYNSALYISTRNELEWNFKILEAKTYEQRQKIKEEYLEKRKEEIAYNYERFEYDYLAESSDIQELPNFMKAFIWQWIVYPTRVNPDFLKLRILTLKEEEELEKKIAYDYWFNYPIKSFVAWKSYEIKNRKFIELWDIKFLQEIKYSNPETDLKTPVFLEERFWPLNNVKRNPKAQENIILNLLNTRFLPYRLANTEDPLKNAILNSPNHKYVIRINYWIKEDNFPKNYYYDFSSFEFKEEKAEHKHYNEDYWANDIEDFFNWRQELYSNFLHNLNPKKTYRFWTCLWANFLNNDLIYKKFDFHFKRAIMGKKVNSFVLKKWWKSVIEM